jgi:hypothetical protein
MKKTVWTLGLVLLCGLVCLGEEKAAWDYYSLTIDSVIKVTVGPNTIPVKTKTVLAYSFEKKENSKKLLVDSMMVQVNQSGKQVLDHFLSRKKIRMVGNNQNMEVFFDGSEEAEKVKKENKIEDKFMHPICDITYDKEKNITLRNVIAKPGALDLVNNGMIDNALTFQARYEEGKKELDFPCRLSIGSGNFVTGTLKLTRTKDEEGKAVFEIKGILANKSCMQGRMQIKDAKYVVKGEQTYNKKLNKWESGKMECAVTFLTLAGITVHNKGTMILALQTLSEPLVLEEKDLKKKENEKKDK